MSLLFSSRSWNVVARARAYCIIGTRRVLEGTSLGNMRKLFALLCNCHAELADIAVTFRSNCAGSDLARHVRQYFRRAPSTVLVRLGNPRFPISASWAFLSVYGLHRFETYIPISSTVRTPPASRHRSSRSCRESRFSCRFITSVTCWSADRRVRQDRIPARTASDSGSRRFHRRYPPFAEALCEQYSQHRASDSISAPHQPRGLSKPAPCRRA